jgi:hypothetical protein
MISACIIGLLKTAIHFVQEPKSTDFKIQVEIVVREAGGIEE